MPESLRELYDDAFSGCAQLKRVQLNEGLTELGARAFANSAITSIQIPRTVKAIKHLTFRGCDGLENVQLQDGLEEIENGGFARCGISEIFIPKSVSHIGTEPFNGCPNLKQIVFEEGSQFKNTKRGDLLLAQAFDDSTPNDDSHNDPSQAEGK